MFGSIVYMLCAATSALCAWMLLRGYRASKARLLLWSALCFFGLALNNLMLLIDVRLMPDIDLSVWRMVPAVVGAAALIYGLVWEAEP